LHYENLRLPSDFERIWIYSYETVCSLLYQTNHIKTRPYLHIYIKSYNTQHEMDYINVHIGGIDTLMVGNECLG
jgi:hypothetical protein